MASSKSKQQETVSTSSLLSDHRNQLIVFLIALVVLFLRRPDIITHAQFWAEDGAVWYQAAYTHHFSLSTLLTPYSNYLIVVARLIAVLSAPLGLLHAPLFFNLTALIIETVPLIYLWGSRFSKLIQSNWLKIYITAAYLVIPYTAEIHGTVTNSQWFLAIAGFMILFLPAATKRWQNVMEKIFLFVICLSGPFSLLLLPVIVFDRVFYKKKQLITNDKIIIIATAAFIQMLVLLLFDRHNYIYGQRIADGFNNKAIGINVTDLLSIIGGQVFGGAIFGQETYGSFLSKPWVSPMLAVLGLEFMLYVWWKGPRLLKAFILYALLVLVAALSHPAAMQKGTTWWGELSLPEKQGGRYYFLPHLALYISLGWVLICYHQKVLKYIAASLLVLALATGVRSDLQYPAIPDFNYQQAVRHFETLHNGQKMIIIINPGPPWALTVEK